jgi:hypothetical protein
MLKIARFLKELSHKTFKHVVFVFKNTTSVGASTKCFALLFFILQIALKLSQTLLLQCSMAVLKQHGSYKDFFLTTWELVNTLHEASHL